ncbi:MAG: hypothetical protein J4215_05145 [Candidatus Diapherotrites archaeon]|uniref:Class III signal peptide-containing protein n=1 Tax=Candidatus Iainarchaeum sp. TaxID=3101447 RepID=A0A8T4LB62_9ARCH|nr:hypothetical protein [Candidatus Diapherotrites archaeon]
MRGQISFEGLISVLLILVFLVIAVSSILNIQEYTLFISDSSFDMGNCSRLSELVQEVFIQGPGTQIVVEARADFVLNESSISVNEAYCFFSGIAQPASLSKGMIVLSNRTGVVEVENQ